MIIRIGSTVKTHHGIAKVIKIEKCKTAGEKYGDRVSKINTKTEHGVIDMDNQHFTRIYNVEKVFKNEEEIKIDKIHDMLEGLSPEGLRTVAELVHAAIGVPGW